MRSAWLVAFLTLPVVACAAGATNDSLDDREDPVDSGGGSKPTEDAEGTPYDFDTGAAADTGTGTGADTGVGTPHDAGTVLPDTGPGVTFDAGAHDGGGAVDSAPRDAATLETGKDAAAPDSPLVTATCPASPTDISAGGSFAIDTCTSTTTVATTCGTTAAAVILRGDSPMSGSTYSVAFPTGWVLEELDDTCTPELFSCGSTGTWSVSGATGAAYWYFALEPASGTCGTATVTVDRLM